MADKKANVFSNALFRFISFEVLLFLLIYLLGSNYPTISIIIFSLLSFLLAILFPIFICTLPKDTTDFWYYSFAVIGVLLFYINTEMDRQKINIAESMVDLSNTLLSVETKQSNLSPEKLSRYLAKNSSEVHDIFNLPISSFFCALIRPLMNKASVEARILEYPKATVLIPTGDGQEIDYLCDHKFIIGDVIENLMIPVEPNTLASYIDDLGKHERKALSNFDVSPYHWYLTARLLKGQVDLTYLEEQILNEKKSILNNIDLSQLEIEKVSRKKHSKSTVFLQKIQFVFWPYFIVAALMLKIARVRYV